ncbi:MAG: hypothetical protein AAFO99_13740 [Bacteroidota bacterium]
MKNKNVSFLGYLLLAGILFVSCESDDENTTEANDVPSAEVVTFSQYQDAQSATDEIDGVVGDVFGQVSGTNKDASSDKITDCVEVTSTTEEDLVNIMIDYGEACELPNGDIVSGVINVSYDTSIADEIEIVYGLENYTYNDIKISGEATAVYDFENENGNISYSSNSNLDFEWSDGLTASGVTASSSETVFENSDDTFSIYSLITGNSSTDFSNGDIYTTEITTPLRTELRCVYIVSGVLVETENAETLTTDYGDGECDDVATQTDGNGNVTTIDLDDIDENDEVG